ncbi:MAG: amino acid permease [Acidobacteria bacterium]|nr:amino acid permease [Acidobacteriota bacterium]
MSRKSAVAALKSTGHSAGLVRGLGLLDATTLVIGSMIGSGIFLVSADVARQVASPGLLILTWVIAGLVTLICAHSYGELAAAMPQSGGQYVYLREAFGPLYGFLFGWAFFLVIQTGTIAAVGVAFAKFVGVMAPWVSSTNFLVNLGTVSLPFTLSRVPLTISTQQFVAILSIALLTFVNCFGVRAGAWVQNIFTIAKTAALLGLALLGLAIGSNPAAIHANFSNFWQNADWGFSTWTMLGVAMVGPLFAYDAWYTPTFTGEEVRNPRRNLPLSLVLGVGIVSVLYIATNFVYLSVLPLEGSPDATSIMGRGIQYAMEDRVGTAAAQMIFGGAGLWLMALAIMISTFGCNNGLILGGARVVYAMARHRLFFSRVARVHPRYHTPAAALVVMGIWSCLLTLSGTYSQLLDYIMFASLLFYILTLGALFVLRHKRPDIQRPHRSWGYPWLPLIYIAVVGFIEVEILIHKPGYTWPGLIIVLLGVPVFYLWRGMSKRNVE